MRAAAAVAVLAAMTAPARARTRIDVATITIDAEAAGDAQILVEDTDIWIRDAILCAHRLCREGTRVHEGDRYVSLTSLHPDVTFVFHRDAGELVITSAAASHATTVIDLAERAPAGLEHGTAPSLFVNYAVTGQSDSLGTRAGAVVEAGFSVGSALLYTAVANTTRGLSYLSYDHEPSMTRVVAGDDVASSGVLGSTSVIGGLHIKRDFSLDPYFVARPTLSHTGLVTTPSTVEVYRGGQLVRRETLAPGPFRVEDVTGAAGLDAQVVVKDAFGASRATITNLIAPPLGLLKPDLHAFDYSVGFVRQRFATASFDYGTPALFANHRVGLTPHLTIGARMEASLETGNVGASLTTQAGHFVLEGSAAASNDGAALSLHGTWQQAAVTFSALARVATADYATLDLDITDDRATRELELSTTFSYSNTTTFMLSAAASDFRDTGDRLRGGVGANFNLWGGAGLLISGSTTNGTTFEAMATFVTALASNTTGSARAGFEAGHRTAAATIARSPNMVGIGGQLDAQAGATSSVGARGSARHAFGRVDADVRWAGGSLSGGVAAAGGLVLIGGRAFATPAIRGGYALVRAPSAGGSRVYRENQAAGRLDSHGDLVVTDLQPFYANHLRLDARELPFAISLSELEHIVAPQRMGGTIVSFVSGVGAIVRGTISVASGDASYGDIMLGELHGPLGHRGAFELEPVAGGTYEGSVLLDGQTCHFQLTVPPNVVEYDAGVVSCR